MCVGGWGGVGRSEDNAFGWKIVLKISPLPSKLRFSANCSFFGQPFSLGHYPSIYQPPKGVYLRNIAFMNFVSFVDYAYILLFQALEMIRGSGKHLKDQFQIEIDPEMVRVQGRVLPPPQLKLGPQDRSLTPKNGSWDMRNQVLFKSTEVDMWALVCFAGCNEDPLRKFCHQMSSVSNQEGMKMASRPACITYGKRHEEVRFVLCSSGGSVICW